MKSLKSSSGLRPMFMASVRQLQCKYAPSLEVNHKLATTAAVHTDCSRACTNRDHRDLMRVMEWLQQHHLFADGDGDEWKLMWPGAWHGSYRK